MSPTTQTNTVHNNWDLQWDKQRGAITSVPCNPMSWGTQRRPCLNLQLLCPGLSPAPGTPMHGTGPSRAKAAVSCPSLPGTVLASSASATLAMLRLSQLQLETSCCCFPGHCATLLGLGKPWRPGRREKVAFPCPFCLLSNLGGSLQRLLPPAQPTPLKPAGSWVPLGSHCPRASLQH